MDNKKSDGYEHQPSILHNVGPITSQTLSLIQHLQFLFFSCLQNCCCLSQKLSLKKQVHTKRANQHEDEDMDEEDPVNMPVNMGAGENISVAGEVSSTVSQSLYVLLIASLIVLIQSWVICDKVTTTTKPSFRPF
jgi:hypothetical protein